MNQGIHRMMELSGDEVSLVAELRKIKTHGFGYVTAKVQNGMSVSMEAMKQIKLA